MLLLGCIVSCFHFTSLSFSYYCLAFSAGMASCLLSSLCVFTGFLETKLCLTYYCLHSVHTDCVKCFPQFKWFIKSTFDHSPLEEICHFANPCLLQIGKTLDGQYGGFLVQISFTASKYIVTTVSSTVIFLLGNTYISNISS